MATVSFTASLDNGLVKVDAVAAAGADELEIVAVKAAVLPAADVPTNPLTIPTQASDLIKQPSGHWIGWPPTFGNTGALKVIVWPIFKAVGTRAIDEINVPAGPGGQGMRQGESGHRPA